MANINTLLYAIFSLICVKTLSFSVLSNSNSHKLRIIQPSLLTAEACTVQPPSVSSNKSTTTKLQVSTSESSSIISEDIVQPERSIGKFQGDLYTKPIVFFGSSGNGNEIYRLATSYASSVSNGLEIKLEEALIKSKLDAIVLDVQDPTMDIAKVEEVAKNYYDNDFLVIYVNVKGEGVKYEDIFIENSDFEICIKEEDMKDGETSEIIEWQLKRLLARAFLPLAIPGSEEPTINTAHLTMGHNTFFLSLSFPEITDNQPYIESMCQDVDAMEFRSDLLTCRDDRFEVLYSLQKIREMCRPHATRAPMLPFLGSVIEDSMPVVYTVRTAHQAGTYPDDEEGISKMFDLLHLGLRGAVEILDVESAWDPTKTNELMNQVEDRYATLILGSFHMVGKKVSDDEALFINRRCGLKGRAHGAKVVLSIEEEADDHQALDASQASKEAARAVGDPVIPHISLILGDTGKYSRVLNLPFTPVTHESLPFVAAPGQMTASQLMATRLIMGHLTPKKYGILGHHISYSVSPAMQGAAFVATSLPHSFDLIDMESVDEFVKSDLWNDSAFGGCSVTIPHKQAIIPHLDELTSAAKYIGAVNTVIVKEPSGEMSKRTIIGDNTDWKGIYNPLERKLSGRISDDKVGVALILGGGGTARAAAYAASQLGLDRIYYNRTPTKAQDLAVIFGGTVASSLEDDENDNNSLGSILKAMNGDTRVVISTLPAAAEFELPNWFVDAGKEKDQKPIIFDVNYKPYWTKLLHQSNDVDFPIVRGSEMLWEQGIGQFELWTKRTAPYKVMKEVVLENCIPEEEETN